MHAAVLMIMLADRRVGLNHRSCEVDRSRPHRNASLQNRCRVDDARPGKAQLQSSRASSAIVTDRKDKAGLGEILRLREGPGDFDLPDARAPLARVIIEHRKNGVASRRRCRHDYFGVAPATEYDDALRARHRLARANLGAVHERQSPHPLKCSQRKLLAMNPRKTKR